MAWHGIPDRWVMAGNNLHALSAVGNARGGEVGDLEDDIGAGHGGGGEGEDGGELHLDGWWGLGGWWRELEVVLS